jgi:hypothetical protein
VRFHEMCGSMTRFSQQSHGVCFRQLGQSHVNADLSGVARIRHTTPGRSSLRSPRQTPSSKHLQHTAPVYFPVRLKSSSSESLLWLTLVTQGRVSTVFVGFHQPKLNCYYHTLSTWMSHKVSAANSPLKSSRYRS